MLIGFKVAVLVQWYVGIYDENESVPYRLTGRLTTQSNDRKDLPCQCERLPCAPGKC